MNLNFEKTLESWSGVVTDEDTGNEYSVIYEYDNNCDWETVTIFDLQTDEPITEGELYEAIKATF